MGTHISFDLTLNVKSGKFVVRFVRFFKVFPGDLISPDLSQTLSVTPVWEGLHHLPVSRCPCTGLASKGDDTFVSVGEDGRLNMMNVERRQPTRTIGEYG